jgi:hypothetical protein
MSERQIPPKGQPTVRPSPTIEPQVGLRVHLRGRLAAGVEVGWIARVHEGPEQRVDVASARPPAPASLVATGVARMVAGMSEPLSWRPYPERSQAGGSAVVGGRF